MALLKVTHEIGRLAQVLQAISRASSETRARARLRASPAIGVAWLGVAADAAQLAAFTTCLRTAAREFGGSTVVLDAPDAARDGLDLWGPVGGLELMAAVKHQFDPGRRMAPGRFVGGL
jgi:glycolate oxidase FAD binding subunit